LARAIASHAQSLGARVMPSVKLANWLLTLLQAQRSFYDAQMTPTPASPKLQDLFNAQYAASRQHIEVSLDLRRHRLLRMKALIDDHGAALAQAVQKRRIVQS